MPLPVPTKTTSILELINSDLCGPFPTESYGGSKYFLTVIDDYSRFCWIFFLKRKSDAAVTLHSFFNLVERQHDLKIKRIRTDNGGEYVNNELKEFFAVNGILHKLTPAYSPESNGIAKRFNQTVN